MRAILDTGTYCVLGMGTLEVSRSDKCNSGCLSLVPSVRHQCLDLKTSEAWQDYMFVSIVSAQ